jgi:site-specific recombinase XerD
MQFETLISLFLAHYESEATKRGYKTAILSWYQFIGDDFLQATPDDVHLFIERRRKDPGQKSRLPCQSSRVTSSTIKRQLTILKTFYTFLKRRKQIAENPFEEIEENFRAPAEPTKRPTRAMTNEQLHRMLMAPDIRTKDGIRDRAILAALFGGGLRRRETIHLTLADCLMREDGVSYLRVCFGKGGKYREVTLGGWAAEMISALISQRKDEGARSQDPLFVWYYADGRAKRSFMDSKTFYRRFKEYLELVGLPGDFSPHSARATAVTRMKQQKIENRYIKLFTGHSTDLMIERYDKRENSIQANPGHLIDYGFGGPETKMIE